MFRRVLLPLFGSVSLIAGAPASYESQNEKTAEQAAAYLKTHECSLRYLIFRDIPHLLNHYVQGKSALDYGVGSGSSSQFLKEQGFHVVGVDISQEMLQQTAAAYPDRELHLVENGKTPFASATFDLVLSSCVLFEIGTQQELLFYLTEAARVLKKQGTFLALTGSEYAYSKEWQSLKVDYPENQNLKSGDLAKCYLIEADIEFTDYYWTESDYRALFTKAGLEMLEVHYPLGKESDPYTWKDERNFSPYVIFIARKIK